MHCCGWVFKPSSTPQSVIVESQFPSSSYICRIFFPRSIPIHLIMLFEHMLTTTRIKIKSSQMMNSLMLSQWIGDVPPSPTYTIQPKSLPKIRNSCRPVVPKLFPSALLLPAASYNSGISTSMGNNEPATLFNWSLFTFSTIQATTEPI